MFRLLPGRATDRQLIIVFSKSMNEKIILDFIKLEIKYPTVIIKLLLFIKKWL
jgi:hypothetical protein